jgi:hypothetical protein
MKYVVAVVAMAAAFATPAFAQIDPSAAPLSGVINLDAGFLPDPYEVSVFPGGDIAASSVSNGCSGYVSAAPDVRVNWNGSGGVLSFSTTSDIDSVLLINMPNGSWRCDDDSAGNMDAKIAFRNAPSGTYDIWIGSISEGGGSGNAGTLNISESE